MRSRAKALRESVGIGDLRIAEYFKIVRIMPGKEREKIVADDMLSEIGRDVADPQAALGRAVVGVGPDELPQRLGVLLVPAAIFFGDGSSIEARMKMERVDQITVGFVVGGLESDRSAEGRYGLIKLTVVLQRDAEIAIGFGIAGF